MIGKLHNDWIWIKWNLHGVTDGNTIVLNVLNVYAPQSSTEKQRLWEKIGQILSNCHHEQFCLACDFNSIKEEGESRNCKYRRRTPIIFYNSLTIISFGTSNHKTISIRGSQR